MQRVAEREHHVVRHVDDVRDRPHTRAAQARAQPERRGADRDVAEETADVARAAGGILDAHVDGVVARAGGIGSGQRLELAVEKRGHLTRDSVNGEQVGPVACRLDLEDLLDEREHIGERSARFERVVEDDDSLVIGTEVHLVLGEDHPLRHLAAQLAPLERQPVRQRRTRHRDGDLRPGSEVPRTAHDLERLPLADIDAAELEPVGVRMLVRLEHVPDAEERRVGGPTALDPVHFRSRERKRVRDLLGGRVDADVLPQPCHRDLHQNWRRKRRSFSQNGRRLSMLCCSWAVRSMPTPNAKPVYSSGSQPTNS